MNIQSRNQGIFIDRCTFTVSCIVITKKEKDEEPNLVFALEYEMEAYSLISCHFRISSLKNIVGLYRVHADHLQAIRRLHVDSCRVAVDFYSLFLQKEKSRSLSALFIPLLLYSLLYLFSIIYLLIFSKFAHYESKGHRFESCWVHQIRLIILIPLVLKLSTFFFLQNA